MDMGRVTDYSEEVPALPCSGKLAFDTRREAAAAAQVAHYQHGARLHVYQCRYCRLWHLSSGGGDD